MAGSALGRVDGAGNGSIQPSSGASAQSSFDTSEYASKRRDDPYIYQVGFGNVFASQALEGILPEGQNSPRSCKYGLYAEGINGTPFTAPRVLNQRTWLYRILPSVAHDGISIADPNPYLVSDFSPSNPNVHVNHTQSSWRLPEMPSQKLDFIQGLRTFAGCGTAVSKEGIAWHFYLANESMDKKAFMNADGDFLFVPWEGRLDIRTELGRMMVSPGEIAVVQSGLKFQVELPDATSRGAVYEVYGNHFTLPELGPLGANGMANIRDFEHPVASFDVDQSPWSVIHKVGGELFDCKQDHTPFDVVGWHGNYVPYKYDMKKFVITQSVNKDHTDPSILCVLQVKSKYPGISFMEFCTVQEFWTTTKDTFRLPYFHRNCLTEYVSTISSGHRPSGTFGYSGFTPHGITAEQWRNGTNASQEPELMFPGMFGYMVEPFQMFLLTDFAMQSRINLPRDLFHFKPNFLDHLDAVNTELRATGRPEILTSSSHSS